MAKKVVAKKSKTVDSGSSERGAAGASLRSSDQLLKDIQNKFGEGAIMKLGDTPKVNIEVVPTGSIGLDYALGVGGLPRGRIVEIFGPESSGKTTLTLHVIAEAQKMGGLCAFIDAEHAMDPEYAKKLGVNINELLIAQPDHGEQALEIAESIVSLFHGF
jgi:recombination protein RecA